MYSYKHSLLPSMFNDLFYFNNPVHNYDTRYPNDFHLPFCRTNLRKFSVSFQGQVYSIPWLMTREDEPLLLMIIKDSISLPLFKNKLSKHFCASH